MALSPGDRVGPYIVLEHIGEGGMGQVFRAHDPRLKRDVAFKVLPASSVGDSERRRRFEREAQVLASLNHPSIAQIFGVALDGDAPIIVMEKDPEWSALPAHTPPALIETLQRCLHKDIRHRIRDIGDVRFEIERSLKAGASQPAARRSPLQGAAWFAAGLALAAGIAAVGTPRTATEIDRDPTHTSISLPPHSTLALGRGSSVAISPDGRLVAFRARANIKTQLCLRPIDRFESAAVAGSDDATDPFFSPDGRWVGCFSGEKLKKVSIDGGAPVNVADVLNPRGEAWGADDTIYVTPSNNAGLSRVPARGGKPEPFTRLKQGELSHRWPALLPDGKTMVLSIWNDCGWDVSRIAAQQPGDRDSTPIVEAGGGYPRCVRDAGTKGFLVYARAEGLLAAPFDETTLALNGQSVPVLDGLLTNGPGGAHFDLSPSGTLAYVIQNFLTEWRQRVRQRHGYGGQAV